MPSERYTLRKHEILRDSRILDTLFASEIPDDVSRYSFYSYPIRCRYIFKESEGGNDTLQAMFVVSKRFFKRAVKRNKIRRRMKESFRLSKNSLKNLTIQNKVSVSIHLSYNTSEELNYPEINNAIETIIKEISNKLACRID